MRVLFRKPAGIFDEYRALCFKKPKLMNQYMMYMGMFFILFYGKGIEKITAQGNQSCYEVKRRARRMFLPYAVLSYRWAFPANQ